MIATCATTALRISIIRKSIKQNSVRLTQIKLTVASTVICALLHIMKMNLLLTYLKKWKKIQIFSCFTIKQCGALSAKRSTREINACTLITGKIFEENQMCLSIRLSNVRCGTIRKIQKITKMVVLWSTDATYVMVGKSLNSTRVSIKFKNAAQKTTQTVRNRTVHTTTQRLKEGTL